jgi:hypothetical protein
MERETTEMPLKLPTVVLDAVDDAKAPDGSTDAVDDAKAPDGSTSKPAVPERNGVVSTTACAICDVEENADAFGGDVDGVSMWCTSLSSYSSPKESHSASGSMSCKWPTKS